MVISHCCCLLHTAVHSTQYTHEGGSVLLFTGWGVAAKKGEGRIAGEWSGVPCAVTCCTCLCSGAGVTGVGVALLSYGLLANGGECLGYLYRGNVVMQATEFPAAMLPFADPLCTLGVCWACVTSVNINE